MTSKRSPIIAISGAGGFLGAALTDHCLSLGWDVRALVRNPSRYPNRPGVQYVQYDLESPLDDSILQGVDYLVHAAYAKQDRSHPDAFEINRQAASRLIKASQTHQLKKLVFISSMSAHEEAKSVYGRQKLHIETLVSSTGGVSLRPGLIVGNGGIVKNMATFMRSKHVVPVISGGKQPLQIIAIYDLVKAIERAATNDIGGVLTVATSEVYTYKQFYATLAKHLHTRVLFISVPFVALLSLFRVVAWLHIPLSVGEDSLWGLRMLRAADNKADLVKLGLQPDGLERALQKTSLDS